MSARHDLVHSIISVLKHNRDGSYSTQAARKKRLLLVAKQVVAGGYKIKHIRQLKVKHVQYLVKQWLAQELAPATIKNRLTDIRWVMDKFEKAAKLPSSNHVFGVPDREYITNKDKSVEVNEADLSKILDEDVKMSLLLQREFGLRREEAIKIRINEAVIGDELRLRGSWCKNGRARVLKIRTPEQWHVINCVKNHIGKHDRSLIPEDSTYVQQLGVYARTVAKAGLSKLHGLRHAYAQRRYAELTGFACSAKGGKSIKDMAIEERRLDH